MSLAEKKAEIVDELQFIDDPNERFAYIIDRAKEQPPLPDEAKIDQFLIEGCVSQLWILPSFDDGKCAFRSDADAMITKGTAGLLCDLYSDATPEEILAEDASFLGDLGITQHLTPNRRNGLTNVIKRIHGYARLCQEEYQQN